MSENDTRKVLITGAGGALAQQVINRLAPPYLPVIVDFRRRVVMDEDIPSYFIHLEKRGFEDIFRDHRIEAVIHLGRISMEEPNRMSRYNANVLGTKHLLDLCVKYEVGQVLLLSTFLVYGAHPYNPALLDETAPLKASELTRGLVDFVELENLAHIYMWKHPQLQITILRPCSIVGPGMRNTMSLLLSRKTVPVLAGFSPMLQLVHIGDMAAAILAAFRKNVPGIYNVAPNDWIALQEALVQCGCRRVPIASAPSILPAAIVRLLNMKAFPPALINYFKYPVVIDGGLFETTFDFRFSRGLGYIFEHYRRKKGLES